MNLQSNSSRASPASAKAAGLWIASLDLETGSLLAARHKLWVSGLLEVRQVGQQHWGIHLDLSLQRLDVSGVHAVALKPVSKEGG